MYVTVLPRLVDVATSCFHVTITPQYDPPTPLWVTQTKIKNVIRYLPKKTTLTCSLVIRSSGFWIKKISFCSGMVKNMSSWNEQIVQNFPSAKIMEHENFIHHFHHKIYPSISPVVGGLVAMNFIFPNIGLRLSSQLTNSIIFQDGVAKNHQPVWIQDGSINFYHEIYP